MAAEDIPQAPEKCIRLSAQIAARKQKFLSNQLKEGLSTAETAMQSISQKETGTN